MVELTGETTVHTLTPGLAALPATALSDQGIIATAAADDPASRGQRRFAPR
ncbi:hypothetical protein GCM10011579_032640 [Streptomyces albiflavescens]|uniref:Uncharacterized protein n=1 Tax=Streptomyces albiflavescens TaxID=1623582 RepID=A0A917Y2X8_9ACTN|nr:hypothetical protein [Streptomyces albiflavescens]GGN63859.1 hypothetical protein GCM10011579_032640 [Streptomyces albiflavescens]